MTILIAACTQLQGNRSSSDSGPMVARAFFTNQKCEHLSQSESVTGAVVTTYVIGKAAEYAVNYAAASIAKAAKEDQETFTVTGQNADFLFSVEKGQVSLRRCLYVAVAPLVQQANWCNGQGNWYDPVACNAPDELKSNWEKLHLGTPAFFAEIELYVPEGGPAGNAIPTVTKAYYPEPISNMSASKVKGLTISVTASKPTVSTKTPGNTAMEVFIGGDGVTPTSVKNGLTNLQATGLWVGLPSDVGTAGANFAGPVNLAVSVAETPHPTKWLQEIAKFVNDEANKQKAQDFIVKNLDPVAREQASTDSEAAANKEIETALTLQGKAAEDCTTLSNKITALTNAKKDVDNGKGANEEETLQYKYTQASACSAARLQRHIADLSWGSSGEDGANLCRRGSDAVTLIDSLCQIK